MDGIGSFGLPGGLSAIPAQLDNPDDKERRRKASKSGAASATATTCTSRSRRSSSSSSSSTSSSATSRSSVACYPLFQSLARKGGATKLGKKRSENEEDDLSSIEDSDDDNDDDDNDEVPLASLAGSRSKSTGRNAGTGLRIGESNAKHDRRGSNSSGAKRRKLDESRSSSDVSSTTSARHNTGESGASDKRGRKQQQQQQQRRQLGIGAFLARSRENSATASAPANILTSTSAAITINANDISLDRADTESNGDPVPLSDNIPVALSDNGATSSASDGGIVDEEDQIDPKQYSNAIQFGMQHGAVPPNTLPSEFSNEMDRVNVLSALFRRSISIAHGRTRSAPRKPCRPEPTNALRRFANASDKWSKCETVRLPAHGVVALEFDRLGVLLATADARGIISVYDFDELCAADITARKAETCRLTATDTTHSNNRNIRQATSIGPVLAFSTRSTTRISCIKWNPYCEDLLVVSFATESKIRVYDLNSGSDAEGPNHIVLSDADSLRGHLRTEGNISILQLPPTSRKVISLLAGGARGTLRLWNFHRNIARGQKKSQNPTLVWSISPFSSSSQLSADSEGISAICRLKNCKRPSKNTRENESGLILVGGTKGSLAIIDLDKLSKKAFSTKLTPTVVWSSNIVRHIARRRLVVDATLPSNSWMGIKEMTLWGDDSSSRSVPAEEACITIVTNCGWALNASIRGLGRPGKPSSHHSAEASATLSLQIAFKSATTMWLNSDLEEIFVGENALTFSLPPVPTPVCALPGQSSLLAIASVKRNIRLMSIKDKRVLSSLPEAEIERLSCHDGDAILLVDLDSASGEPKGVVSRIPIDNGTPHVLVVHPGGQWMIVGTSGEGRQELTLLCQRCNE